MSVESAGPVDIASNLLYYFSMELKPDFAYNPNPSPLPTPPAPAPPPAPVIGLLAGLKGRWEGHGFNAIWRPNLLTTGQDRFLELNVTDETLEFDDIPGGIPNRGLLQPDIVMAGLRYLQQISDANVAPPNNGLHIEPGLWLSIPATTNPAVSTTIARLASIPHGTTVLAQGLISHATGKPAIPDNNLNPFSIGGPPGTAPFPEQNLATTTVFRTADLKGIDQTMVNNPNSVLQSKIASQNIKTTVTLHVSSTDLPVEGGGTTNTAFLVGGAAGPNANTALVTSTFWLETVEGTPDFQQLQYSQTVILNFNGLSWPHVTVANLVLAT
jgi:hypothetical protein